MPELNKKSQCVESELQSLETAAVDQARYLQLAESLDGFRIKLRERAKTLEVCERQQILRLLVKEVLVAPDSLTIRHSIPIPQTGPDSNGPQPTGSHSSGASQKPGYLLRSRSKGSPPGEPQRSAAAAKAGADSRPDPEVVAKAKRRTYSTEYKQRILEEADAAAATRGAVGALLRREGLYYSLLATWRPERASGIREAVTAQLRGPKAKREASEEEN